MSSPPQKKKKKKFCLPIQSPKRYYNMYMYLLTKETKKLDDDDKHLGGVEKSRPKNQKVRLLSLWLLGSLAAGGIKYPRTKTHTKICSSLNPVSEKSSVQIDCVHIPVSAVGAAAQMDSVHLSDTVAIL